MRGAARRAIEELRAGWPARYERAMALLNERPPDGGALFVSTDDYFLERYGYVALPRPSHGRAA